MTPTSSEAEEEDSDDPRRQHTRSTPNSVFAAENARARRTQPSFLSWSISEFLVLLLLCAPFGYFVYRDIMMCLDVSLHLQSVGGSTAAISSSTGTSTPETAPWPGSTFVILEKRTGRAIAVAGHQLSLEKRKSEKDFGDRRMHWVCEEKDGWLGFRNAATGTYSKWTRDPSKAVI